MTDIDILKDSVNTLGNLSVPISLFDAIGEPVCRVRKNLLILLNFVVSKQNEATKTEEEIEKPEEETLSEEVEEIFEEKPEN